MGRASAAAGSAGRRGQGWQGQGSARAAARSEVAMRRAPTAQGMTMRRWGKHPSASAPLQASAAAEQWLMPSRRAGTRQPQKGWGGMGRERTRRGGSWWDASAPAAKAAARGARSQPSTCPTLAWTGRTEHNAPRVRSDDADRDAARAPCGCAGRRDGMGWGGARCPNTCERALRHTTTQLNVTCVS